METKSFLRVLPFVQRIFPASPSPVLIPLEEELKSTLLKCGALSEGEIDAYIAYETKGIVYEKVPLDYDCPGKEISCLYSDGELQVKILRRHTNRISPETLEKVQQALLALVYPNPP